METKHISFADAQIKAVGDSYRFSGYAATFTDVDSYGDTIARGAFKSTLRNRTRPIRMRWNHFGPIIGLWQTIREDDIGLYVEGELTKGHSVAENVYASLKHGAIEGLSIGYIAKRSVKNEHGGRHLIEIDLAEISVVEEPANMAAAVESVKLADVAEQITSWKDLSAYLRNGRGFSKSEAEAVIYAAKRISRESRHKSVAARIAERLHGASAIARLRGEQP